MRSQNTSESGLSEYILNAFWGLFTLSADHLWSDHPGRILIPRGLWNPELMKSKSSTSEKWADTNERLLHKNTISTLKV